MNNQFEEKNALMENLIACTNSDNYKIRAAAYTALGNFVDIDEVLYKMKDGLVDSNPEVREASVKSLRKIYNERKEKIPNAAYIYYSLCDHISHCSVKLHFTGR